MLSRRRVLLSLAAVLTALGILLLTPIGPVGPYDSYLLFMVALLLLVVGLLSRSAPRARDSYVSGRRGA